ncbi:MAG: hypothetical protein IT442_10885, partial [Phycisphaeraceae bacterium]|nr:hypothetical protein [Phycisphaeraceae bacterium]
ATAASLVILDEIGRGTSTLDGLSLAWAIAEFLAQRGCRTLFATHYHELTDLAERYENVANLNVTVREWADQIVFLHRIVPGATDRSYGIHVAKIAGLPGGVVQRAQELLGQLSVQHGSTASGGGRSRRRSSVPANQMGLFAPPPPSTPQEHPLIDEMRQIDLASLNPMQAFDLLRQWQQRLGDGQG